MKILKKRLQQIIEEEVIKKSFFNREQSSLRNIKQCVQEAINTVTAAKAWKSDISKEFYLDISSRLHAIKMLIEEESNNQNVNHPDALEV